MLTRQGPRRPKLERAAREARAGVCLPLLANLYGHTEGAILGAAGLTFETQRLRERVRADLAFASPFPMEPADLDRAVWARMGDL